MPLMRRSALAGGRCCPLPTSCTGRSSARGVSVFGESCCEEGEIEEFDRTSVDPFIVRVLSVVREKERQPRRLLRKQRSFQRSIDLQEHRLRLRRRGRTSRQLNLVL